MLKIRNYEEYKEKEESQIKARLANKLFGKRFKDLTLEEKKYYKRIFYRLNKEKYYKYQRKKEFPLFCLDNFGKRYRDLDKDEMRLFWKLQQRISRENRKVGENKC